MLKSKFGGKGFYSYICINKKTTMNKETVFWALYYHIFEAIKGGIDAITFVGEQREAAEYFQNWINTNY